MNRSARGTAVVGVSRGVDAEMEAAFDEQASRLDVAIAKRIGKKKKG